MTKFGTSFLATLAAAGSAAVLGFASAGAQETCTEYSWDTDGDGVYEQYEWESYGDVTYGDWDYNDDGLIGQDEFEQCWSAAGYDTAAYEDSNLFEGWDSDGDGYIDNDEFFNDDNYWNIDENNDGVFDEDDGWFDWF